MFTAIFEQKWLESRVNKRLLWIAFQPANSATRRQLLYSLQDCARVRPSEINWSQQMKTRGRQVAMWTMMGVLASSTMISLNAQENSESKWTSITNVMGGSYTNWGRNATKGSGNVKQETRAIAGVTALNLRVPADVIVTQGDTESITITTDDNLLPLIQTRVEDGVLKIDGERARGFSTRKGVKVALAIKSLSAITIDGSGDIKGDTLRGTQLDIAIRGSGDVKFKTLRVDTVKSTIDGSGDIAIDAVVAKSVEGKISGSGDITFASVKCDKLKAAIDGSGDFAAAGIADVTDIRIHGSGDVRTKGLLAREVTVSIQSSGGAEVNATQKLTASVSGSGEVRYVGTPKDISKNVQGSGSISAL
jgi:hypothetical protein